MKIIFVLLVIAVCQFVRAIRHEEFECPPYGTHYYTRENCLICSCASGRFTCGHSMTPTCYKNFMRKCLVGTTYETSCGQCWCARKYGEICSLEECSVSPEE